MSKINVGGLLFDDIHMNEAIDRMEKTIKKHKGTGTEFLCVANQDTLSHTRSDNDFSIEKLNKAFLTIPDGFSIVYASKYLRTPLPERVTGPDLMEKFMEISNVKGYKNFFLGAASGVAEKMKNKFLKLYPNLKICGIYSPPFGKFDKEENNKIIKMVNKSKADVLWVSFGCPKQEKWIIENMGKINVSITAGVGAAFDFHSGNKKRAPLFLQKLRLEWFFRLIQEPKRLWKRYLLGGILFFKIIFKQKKDKVNHKDVKIKKEINGK